MARTGRRGALIVCAVAASGFLLGACGGSSPTAAPAKKPTGFRVVYKQVAEGETVGTVTYLSDGAVRRRVRIDDGSDVMTYITDGKRAVSIFNNEPPQEEAVGGENDLVLIVHAGDGTLAKACPDAKPTGTATIAGRSAARYRCAEGNAAVVPGSEIAVDRQTGLVLELADANRGELTATAVDVHASLPADTFVVPATAASKGGFDFQPFTTAKVGGGTLDIRAYRGRRLIIASAGTPARLRGLTATVKAAAGSAPIAVVGLLRTVPPAGWTGSLLNPADVRAAAKTLSARVGTFAIPVGFDWKGAITGNLIEAIDWPTSADTVVVLVGSDGKRAATLQNADIDAKLAAAVASLK